jgi:hypothetical protein
MGKFVLDTAPLVPGQDCCRCGNSRKEARRHGAGCYAWGVYYKQHIWTWRGEAPDDPAA